MFAFVTRRLRDMRRLSHLFQEAERLANREGVAEPAAEHLLLAALDMPEDDGARRALARHGATPGDLRAAIERQYADALATVGIAAPPPGTTGAALRKPRLYTGAPSLRDLVDAVTSDPGFHRDAGFSTAAILLAATRAEHGIVPRALACLAIDRRALAESARAEMRHA